MADQTNAEVSDERLPVDELAQEIRRVDGNHDLGAAALAEALMLFLTRRSVTSQASEGAGQHKWVKSNLGHGETMCEYCRITNREAAVLGELNACSKAPASPSKRVERLETAGWFWRWASSDEWRPFASSSSEAARADFLRDQEKIAPVVIEQLFRGGRS